MKSLATCLSLFVLTATVCVSQDADPIEILKRTLLIRNDVAKESGTGFKVEHNGNVYLVTARHMVQGLPVTNAMIDVWTGSEWKPMQTVKTLFPQCAEVDIAVFKLSEKAQGSYTIKSDDSRGGVTFGQNLWFLGYPYEIGTKLPASAHWNGGLPFIKRGTMSALDSSNPDAVLLYIDGFNNPGFSGGPIVIWDFTTHTYKILGVVKGFRFENAKMDVNGTAVDTRFLVNSGILVAYSIQHADDAIEIYEKQP